ncbi:5507_t:CDS:10, partial [Racocetra persica]
DSIDRMLTKKTGKAIRNYINDFLSNNQVNFKKSRLTESVNSSILILADSKINKVDHITDLPNEREDESEQFDTRNLLTKKRHSWENVIKEIDIRNDSKKDWIIDKYNLSTEFRNFQLSTIREIEKIPFLSFKTDLHKILCLSNIMLIEQTRPLYLTCVETVWSQICQRQVPPSLPDVVQNMILEYSKLLNAFTPIVDIQKTWCRNFSKVNELSNQDDIEKFCGIQIILRNFLLLNLKANNDNEDTFVHDMLHDLLKEIFRDPIFELIWANSESASSKNRRRNNKENSRGKKPDFKLLVNTNDEILFGEVKSPKYKNLSSLVCQDFVKLANFQSGVQIRIYQMDLEYDGLYRMYLVADVVLPTQKSQFISLVPILEALYNVKDSVSKVLEVITSDTSHILSRSDYCRLPPPSPEFVQVSVVISNER